MELTKEFRPRDFDAMVGQAVAVAVLEKRLASKRDWPSATLITGPSGTGKTTAGRIIIRRLGCKLKDPHAFIEKNSADFRGIDMVRELRETLRYKPLGCPVRGILLDEVHRLTPDAQDAALKMLEDARPWNKFVLCTTLPEKLADTLRRRCMHVKLLPVADAAVKKLVADIAAAKGTKASADLCQKIADASGGSPGVALNLLDKVLDLPEAERAANMVKPQAERDAIELFRLLIKKQTKWTQVSAMLRELKERKEDPEGLRRLLLACADTALLARESGRAFLLLEVLERPFFDAGSARSSLTRACFEVFKSPEAD